MTVFDSMPTRLGSARPEAAHHGRSIHCCTALPSPASIPARRPARRRQWSPSNSRPRAPCEQQPDRSIQQETERAIRRGHITPSRSPTEQLLTLAERYADASNQPDQALRESGQRRAWARPDQDPVVALGQLAKLWALHKTAAQAAKRSGPGQEQTGARPDSTSRQHSDSDGPCHPDSDTIQATVMAATTRLAAAVLDAQAGAPLVSCDACRRSAAAVRALGSLGCHHAGMLADCEARIMACGGSLGRGTGKAPIGHQTDGTPFPLDLTSTAHLMAAWGQLGHTPSRAAMYCLLWSTADAMQATATGPNTAVRTSRAQPSKAAGWALVAVARAVAQLLPGCLRLQASAAATGRGRAGIVSTLPLNAAALLVPAGLPTARNEETPAELVEEAPAAVVPITMAASRWRGALLTASTAAMPALPLPDLVSLLRSSCALELHPPEAWWRTAALHVAMALNPSSPLPTQPGSSQQGGPPTAGFVKGVARPSLESLAWLRLRCCVDSADGAASAKPPPERLVQVIVACLSPDALPAQGPAVLAPMFWSALVLLGPNEWRRLHGTGRLPSETAVLERLHAHLLLLTPRQLVQALHAAGLLGLRPYRAWMTLACQQVQRHAGSFDRDAARLLVWALTALRGTNQEPDPPTTAAMVAALARHTPSLSPTEAQQARDALRRLYRRLTSVALRELVADLDRRAASCVAG